MPALLMIIVSIMVLGYGAALVFCKIPTENTQAFTGAGALLVGAFITITSYYFGSSSSSKTKDETIAKQLAP